jgi:protocatechuate 3,4-dioxygenase beta subunit
MTREIDRRHALRLFGGASAAVALAACGGSKNDRAAEATTTTTASTTSTTLAGTATSTASTVATGAAVTADMFAKASACTLAPSETEGPYYIDVDKIRTDIREDRQGTRLRVAARVVDANCAPVKDAVFEIWHCDAGGLYSGFEAASKGGGGGSTSDTKRYLRGAQITNADGIAELTTVYPGWYRGRTVHIHAKVLLSNTELLTTQLFFDEKLNAEVYASAPYQAHTGRDTLNSNDNIFSAETIMTVSKDGDGYLGLITMGVKR